MKLAVDTFIQTMAIKILGVSHKTAPIAIRERVAVDPERLPAALHGLVRDGGASEALILSTCNRTEVYCNVDNQSLRHPLDWLVRFNGVDPRDVASHVYSYDEENAVRHALRVACGLDSMVLGEPQILGQLKQAYRIAVGQGTAGKLLNRLFQHSFFVAKQVRTQTAIGENPVSVAFAAVKLARQIHGDLSDKTALLIGAGETITLVAHHLQTNRIKQLMVANRTLARSQELAERTDGTAIALDELPNHLADADIIVSSTAARLPLITEGAIRNASKARRRAPMFIVDLAVPRDVEPGAADVENVYLYSVDDLNHVISENSRLREAAANEAEEMINIQAQSYMDWLAGQDSTETIVEIRAHAEIARRELVAKARRRLDAGDDPGAVIDALGNALVARLMHGPTVRIREAAQDGRDDIVLLGRELLTKDK